MGIILGMLKEIKNIYISIIVSRCNFSDNSYKWQEENVCVLSAEILPWKYSKQMKYWKSEHCSQNTSTKSAEWSLESISSSSSSLFVTYNHTRV